MSVVVENPGPRLSCWFVRRVEDHKKDQFVVRVVIED